MKLTDLTPNNCEVAVEQWISLYKENSSQAIVQLYQMLFDATGFEKRLTVNILETKTTMEIVIFFKENIPEGVDAPIKNDRLQVTVAVFFQTLIPECKDFINDHIFLDSLFSLLFHMSRDKMRVFRLLGTLVGVKCVTALLQLETMLSHRESMLTQLLEAEKSKEEQRMSVDRIESLINSTSRIQEDRDEIYCVLNKYAIKTFFRRRVFDVFPDIGCLCINELSIWMLIDPKTFMVPKYLSYMLVVLSSNCMKVRTDCLKSMNLLYERKVYSNELLEFTKRCLNRLVEMTLDKSLQVSVLAIQTLTHILQTYGMSILENVEEVRILVFSRHTVVARAAGVFLLKSLDPLVGKEGFDNAAKTSARGTSRTRNSDDSSPTNSSNDPSTETGGHTARDLLLNLAHFLEITRLPKLAPLLVDALLPSCPSLLAWPAHVDLLLHDDTVCATSGGEVLPPGKELALVKMLAATVRQSCSGKSPRRDAPRSRPNSTLLQRNKIRLQVTSTFLPTLPKLLQRHCNDAEKVIPLLGIAKYFIVSQATLERQHSLTELAKVMEKLFEIHTDDEVLKGCCQVEKYLRQDIDVSLSKFFLLWDNIRSKHLIAALQYLTNITACLQNHTNPDDDQIFALGDSLSKLACLLANEPFSVTVLWDRSMYLLEQRVNFPEFPYNVVMNIINISHLNLLHNMKLLHDKDKTCVNDQSTQSLRTKVLQFLGVLETLLQSNISEITKRAYFIVCDILLIFGEILIGPQDRCVTVMVTEGMQQLLKNFVKKNVFEQHFSDKKKSENVNELRYNILKVYTALFTCNILKYEYISWILTYPRKSLQKTKYMVLLKKVYSFNPQNSTM